jgi:hypothetical protein
MLLWGIAPAVVQRAITGRPPDIAAIPFNGLILFGGVVFVVVHLFVRRADRRAIWTAFLLSAILMGAGLALAIRGAACLTSSFLLLFSSCTCFATWLAIGVTPHAPAQPLAQPAPEAEKS